MRGVPNGKETRTICWDCSNACGACSWSKDFTPVEGWEIEEIMHKDGTGGCAVIKCPQFVKEDRENRKLDLDEQGCLRMVERLMEITREDYMDGETKTEAEIERFLRGHGAARVHRLENPEAVIRMLKKAKIEYRKKRAQSLMVK